MDSSNMNTPKDEETITLEADTLGTITGTVVHVNRKRIASFLGIPYAKQPIGKLRFKPLEALEEFLGTADSPFKALEVGKAGVQIKNTVFGSKLPTGEDCIYLNIWVPLDHDADPGKMKESKKHVFFQIHGGKFMLGSGGEKLLDLRYFVALHDCVGVSINYRLNLLGFVSMPPLIEENLGLKDQQFALKWVHQHIHSFGGDPEKITIYGFSAGAASCHYHLLNPESSKLFSKAMLCSGVVNRIWSMQTVADQKKILEKLLKCLDCPPNSTPEQILDFLQSVDISLISKQLPYFVLGDAPRPVESFCQDPASLIPVEEKPVLVGALTQEGNNLVDLFYPGSEGKAEMTWSRKSVGDFITQYAFHQPMFSFCKQMTSRPDYPLHCFLFDHHGKSRSDEIFPESLIQLRHGKCHFSDTPFMLGINSRDFKIMKDGGFEEDHLVTDLVRDMIEKFMKGESGKIDLPKYSAESRTVVRITSEGMKHESDFKGERSMVAMAPRTFFAFSLIKMSPQNF